jgi:hypothetical protein
MMVVASSTFVDLVGALAWPVVILTAVVLLRRPLGSLLQDLGRRATKLSVFQVGVELATVPEVAPSWKIAGDDVRQLTRADVFDSATMSLFSELSSAGASDYIVVDLGRGDQWLSSRLYVFVVVLQRMRGLRSVVFTTTKRDETGVFVGIADPARVRWALAMACPWLESAFARAYAQVVPAANSPPTPFIISVDGAIEPWAANNLARAFLTELQYPPAVPPAATPPVPPIVAEPPDWIELPGTPAGQPQIWEHATWLSDGFLEQILGPSGLARDFAFTDSPDIPVDDRARAIARRPGETVALVTATGRFSGLVDRRAMLEAVATAYAERQ